VNTTFDGGLGGTAYTVGDLVAALKSYGLLSGATQVVQGAGFGGTGTLSAPTLGYPSPLTSNPTSIVVSIPQDWATGDILKLAYSSTTSLTNFTVISHVLSDS